MMELHEVIRALDSGDAPDYRMPVRVISEEGDVFDIKGFQSDGSALLIEVELSE